MNIPIRRRDDGRSDREFERLRPAFASELDQCRISHASSTAR
jgi:hypothetical protein